MIVEGATEERFYKKTLQHYYIDGHGNYRCYFRVVQMPNQRNTTSRVHKGGAISFARSVEQVQRFIRQASHAELFVLVYDYYGLHPTFTDHLPAQPSALPDRIAAIRQRFEAEINEAKFRFYLQVHEFESLLFSGPEHIAEHFNAPKSLPTLLSVLDEANGNPELINNHRETAPSKRLARLYPGYGKVTDGIPLASKIGVERMRERCGYFHQLCGQIDGVCTNDQKA